jgi:hypothetical protein
MKIGYLSTILKHTSLALVALVATHARSVTIDFETSGTGVPFSPGFQWLDASEYSGQGVRFSSSWSGSNIGIYMDESPLPTHYLKVPATSQYNYLDIFFLYGATQASFDFGPFENHLAAFDASENPVLDITLPLSTYNTGQASVIGIGAFYHLRVDSGGILAIDNLTFTPIPEPSTCLLLLGVASLLAFARRAS